MKPWTGLETMERAGRWSWYRDGKDSGPVGFRQPFVSQAEVIDRARREDVMVYGIGIRSRRARPPDH